MTERATPVSVLTPSNINPVLLDHSLSLRFDLGQTDSRINTVRAGTQTYFDAAGVMQTAAANTLVIDHDPVTHECLGASIWGARTNGISNNTAVGAVAGTPGTLPTSWQKAEAASLTFNVVGSGVDSGVDYVDIRLSGTALASSTSAIQFSQNSQISASNGQTWTNSAYLKIVAGSTSGVNSIKLAWEERSGAFLASQASPALTIATTGSFSTCRQSHSATNTNASTTFVKPIVQFTPISGQVIDMTIRIGLPQMELGASASPAIPTVASQVTRPATVPGIYGADFTGFYNQNEGTFVVESKGSSDQTYFFTAGTSAATRISGHNNANLGFLYVRDASVGQVGSSSGVIGNGDFTFAAAYKANSFAVSGAGGTAVIDLVGSVPAVGEALYIGCYSSGNQTNGYIKSITYFPVKLSTSELQVLSQ